MKNFLILLLLASSVIFAQDFSLKLDIQPAASGDCKVSVYKDGDYTIVDNFQSLTKGTRVRIFPKPQQGYLFDRWEGNKNSLTHTDASIEFYMYNDVNITAFFGKPAKNEGVKYDIPEDFRQKGDSYECEIFGKISGEGIFKNWGIEQKVNYTYIYVIKYTSTIEEYTPSFIRENRTFSVVDQSLLLHKNIMSFETHKEREAIKAVLRSTKEYLKWLVENPENLEKDIIDTMDWVATNLEKISFDEKTMKKIFAWAKKLYPEGEFFINLVEKLIAESFEARIISYAPSFRMLEGKSIILEYENGKGLTKVEALDEQNQITLKEKEMIERAVYLADYYLFLNEEGERPEVGESWKTKARFLAGVMDPGLRSKVDGTIFLHRHEDEQNFAILSLNKKSILNLVSSNNSTKNEGEIILREGNLKYNLNTECVEKAYLKGHSRYESISRDHLLFECKAETTPSFDVTMHCYKK